MTGRTILLAAVLCIFLCPFGAKAGSGPIVALFDMEDRGSKLDPDVLANLVDYLAARLTEGGYQVVPTDQIRDRITASKGKSHKTCYDQSCQIELGRELSAQKTLATKILRIGDTCQVTAVMYDLKKATTEGAATAEAECEVNRLLTAVKQIATKLCAPLKDANRQADAKLAEYEKLVKNVASEKAERERAEKAWQQVLSIAKDDQVPMDKRVQALEKYRADFQKPNPHLDELDGMLADLSLASLVIHTVPAGAQVSINGKPIGKAPITRRVKAGKYRLQASLDGYKGSTSEAKLEAGKNLEVKLTLAKIVAAAPAPAPTPAPKAAPAPQPAVEVDKEFTPSRPMPPGKLWGHVAFWSGIGCAGLATVSAVMAADYGSKTETIEDSKTWGGVFWMSTIGAVGLITTGVVLWMITPDEEPAGTTAGLAPTLDGNGFTFTLSGRW